MLLQLADTDGKDWRADLLTAVHNVFAKDRDSTQAELRTYKIVHRDQAGLLEAMEDKVRQQVRAALSRCISKAHCSLRLYDVLYLTLFLWRSHGIWYIPQAFTALNISEELTMLGTFLKRSVLDVDVSQERLLLDVHVFLERTVSDTCISRVHCVCDVTGRAARGRYAADLRHGPAVDAG